MSDKHLITTAKFVSTMFTPLCVPLLAFAILFTFSYLSLLTLGFRLVVLGMVASFTIILPKFAILLYRKMNGWTLRQASKRENRVVPYLLTITCYIACLYLMYSLAMPRFLSAIIMAGLIVLVICTMVIDKILRERLSSLFFNLVVRIINRISNRTTTVFTLWQ